MVAGYKEIAGRMGYTSVPAFEGDTLVQVAVDKDIVVLESKVNSECFESLSAGNDEHPGMLLRHFRLFA